MNTDRLRSDLQVLADRAVLPDAGLADGVLRRRRQMRDRRLTLGAVVAVGAAAVGVPALLVTGGPEGAQTAAGGGSGGLYDVPTRGSLAADGDLIAQAQAASWDDGITDDVADSLIPAQADRRVAFAGQVPGGQVWALVLGPNGSQLTAAWFADVDPADGVRWQLAASPVRVDAEEPVALVDVAGDHGPLVVVTMPGDEVTVATGSSTSTGAATGTQVFAEVEASNGVAATDPGASVTPQELPAFQVVREDVVVDTYLPRSFDSATPLGPRDGIGSGDGVIFPPDPVHGARIAVCMQEADWPVTMLVDGSLALVGQVTVEGQEELQAALTRCEIESGYR